MCASSAVTLLTSLLFSERKKRIFGLEVSNDFDDSLALILIVWWHFTIHNGLFQLCFQLLNISL